MTVLAVDSTAYLTQEDAAALGVTLIPMNYTIDGHAYLEQWAGCNGAFEAMLARYPNCGTSQASVASYAAVFQQLAEQGCDVLCLVISSRLSAPYSSAGTAARAVDPNRVRVVDSRSTAGGMNLMAQRAAAWIQEGVPLGELERRLLALRERVGIAFSVKNMDALRRSGRVGMVRQSVGTILNLRPILLCTDGAVISDGVARGQQEQVRALAARVPEDAGQVMIQHISDSSLVEPLRATLEEKLPQARISTGTAGPVLAINIGLGAIGVSWLRRDG